MQGQNESDINIDKYDDVTVTKNKSPENPKNEEVSSNTYESPDRMKPAEDK